MINSELLKEAIADAKAVRATALLNAKAALEEAFAPRFEAMFAEKLKEESEEEQEEGLQEVEAPNQVTGKGGEAKGPKTKAVSKGDPKTPGPAAGDKDFKAVQAGLGPKGVPKLGKKVNETAEEEEEEGKKMDESNLTSEDLDEIIKELENEVADEEEGQSEPVAQIPAPEGDEAPSPEGDEIPSPEGEVPSPEGDEVPSPEGDEVPSPEGEVPPAFGGGDVGVPELGGEMNVDLGGEEGESQSPAGMNAGGFPQGPVSQPTGIPGQVPPSPEDDENINLEELLAALNEEADEEEEEGKEMDETVQNHGVPTKGQESKATVKGYPKTAPEKTSPGSHQVTGKNHNISGKGNIGTGAVGGLSEIAKYKVALKESYKTIEFLRGQINEVNLLNAKLLYTNKLFKEFAGVLDDPYRMKIVESFDLTKSVREVKLAYALLAESLNFGTQVTKTKKIASANKPVSTITKGQVKQITEGFASKPVSSTKPSQLITEGNEMALRFKKLAGIKESPKTSEKK